MEGISGPVDLTFIWRKGEVGLCGGPPHDDLYFLNAFKKLSQGPVKLLRFLQGQ
jgi:hypothetical protein